MDSLEDWPELSCDEDLGVLPPPPLLRRQNGYYKNLSLNLPSTLGSIDWDIDLPAVTQHAPPPTPVTKPVEEPAPPQVARQNLDDRFISLLNSNIDKKKVLDSFQALANVLLQSTLGDCRAYHSVLNEWLSARLSRVAAAQMMVRFFAHDKQICFVFKEITDVSLLNRHVRSCIRNFARKQ